MRTTAPRPLLPPASFSFLRRLRAGLLPALLAGVALMAAAQQADPPARAARIELAEGAVQFQTATDPQPRAADPRWPLTTGDTVWTDPGARAELHAGPSTLRLDGGTAVGLTALDDRTTQLRLTAGTLGVQVRSLEAGERFEIDTPNLALVLTRPGTWRIDVDPGQGWTRIAAAPGSAGTVYGENAESSPIAGPLRRDFSGRRLVSPPPLTLAANDDFDRWSDTRDRAIAQSQSARYVSGDVPGVQQLDAYGDWQTDPSYGAIWFPRTGVADWAPYRYGRWESVAPWGWTWIDDAPWGFAPFHYGRWTQAGNRWGWVPGPVQARPAYAPALVDFIGASGGNGSFVAGNGRPGVGWFPLAPGESWRPPFPASPGYIARLNRAGFAQNNITGYYYQTRPNAVTVLGVDDFGRRDAHRARYDAVTAADLARARAVQPPPWSGRGGFAGPGGFPHDRGSDRPVQAVQPFAGGYSGPGGGGFANGPSSLPQFLPPSAPLSDRIQQGQWQRSQQMLEDRQRNEILRQQQLRGAQERFQPDASQRQLQLQREDMQLRQQREEFDRQRAFGGQRELMQRQQMQAQQQQFQMQQRQMQENQQRQQEQQQRQMQQAQQEQRQQMQRLQEQQRQQQQQLPQMQPPPGAQHSPDGRAYRPPRAAPQQH